MSRSRRLWRPSAIIAAILLLSGLALYEMLQPAPAASYWMFPGMRIGAFVATIVSIGTTGGKQAATTTAMLVIAGIINYVCYFLLAWIFLTLAFIGSPKPKVETYSAASIEESILRSTVKRPR
jgi:hypothetical protein